MKKATYLLPIVAICVLSCQPDDPIYLKSIPNIEAYRYIPENIESPGISDTLKPALWYSQENAEVFLRRPTDIVLVGNKYWVSDPLTGHVYATDHYGLEWATIAIEGKGPEEVLHPASIIIDRFDASIVYILDTSLKSLMVYSVEGFELTRIHSRWILGEFYHSHFTQVDSTRFLLTISNHEKSVLGIINENGELVEDLIPKVIPSGYQPMTHNRVAFDYDFDNNMFAFAYKGIPVVFIQSDKGWYAVNFMSHKALHELNTPIDPQPISAQVSVQGLVRSVFIANNTLLVQYNSSLITYDLERKVVSKRFEFLDRNDSALGIHGMRLAGGRLFLINNYTAEIYTVSLSDIIR